MHIINCSEDLRFLFFGRLLTDIVVAVVDVAVDDIATPLLLLLN